MAGAITAQEFLDENGLTSGRVRPPAVAALAQGRIAVPLLPDPSMGPVAQYLAAQATRGPAAAGGAMLAAMGLDCDTWMSLTAVQKAGVVEQRYNRLGFSPNADERRHALAKVEAYCLLQSGATSAASVVPTDATAPAGCGIPMERYIGYPPVYPGGQAVTGSVTGSVDASGATGSSASGAGNLTQTQVLNTAAGLLNTTANTITSIVNSNNQAQIAQLNAQAQTRIAQLQAQAAQTGNAQQQAALQQQISALQALQAQTQSQGLSTGAWIAIGLGGVAVVGLVAWLAMGAGRRRNPFAALTAEANPVVVRRGKKKYVSSRHLARARRAGWRKAARR
jgi:hypothetical protein